MGGYENIHPFFKPLSNTYTIHYKTFTNLSRILWKETKYWK
nr:MAG TPA: hypothetical protein [Caudoviricetes sp.]